MAARVIGSRFAKPLARAALVATGLVALAVIGHSAIASAPGNAAEANPAPTPAAMAGAPVPAATAAPQAIAPAASAAASSAPAPPRGAASEDDPVILNTATLDDLRRLPGIGPKRAEAILALRSRLGRFHAIEDLLKVKGVGRATLKRLRPLIRLEPSTPPSLPARLDGGGVRGT